jgi:hypothetical protein
MLRLHLGPAQQLDPRGHRLAGRLDGRALLAQVALRALQLGQPLLRLLGGRLRLLVLRLHLAEQHLVVGHERLGDGLRQPILHPRQLRQLGDQRLALGSAGRHALVTGERVQVGAQDLGAERLLHRRGDGAVEVLGGDARRVRADGPAALVPRRADVHESGVETAPARM